MFINIQFNVIVFLFFLIEIYIEYEKHSRSNWVSEWYKAQLLIKKSIYWILITEADYNIRNIILKFTKGLARPLNACALLWQIRSTT